MSTRIPGVITGSRAAWRLIQRRKQLSKLAETTAGLLGGGGGLPPLNNNNISTFHTKQSMLCPRCKVGHVDGGANSSVCKSCMLETNALTPKVIYDKLSRFVVGQENVKQVLSVAMFSHTQRVKANDALKYLSETAANAATTAAAEQDSSSSFAEDAALLFTTNDREVFLAAERKLSKEIAARSDRKKRKARFDTLLTGKFEPADRKELREVYKNHPLDLKRELASSERFNQLSLTEQAQWLDELIVAPGEPTTEEEDTAAPAVEHSTVREYEQRLGQIEDLNVKRFDKSNILLLGPTGSGKTLMAKTLAEVMKVPIVICDATSLTAAGYVGDDVESVLYKLMDTCNWEVSRAERGVVFLDEIDKIAKKYLGGSRSKDVGGESVQMGCLKMLEGTKVKLTKKSGLGSISVVLDTSNILFVCSGAFEGIDALVAKRTSSRSLGFASTVAKSYEESSNNQELRDKLFTSVEPTDLIEFGMIPEFVGRFSSITSTSFLTEQDLVRILVEPENSVVNQMKGLFKLSFQNPVDLIFTPGALQAIAKLALQRKSGARGLKLILEKILSETTYDLPDNPWVTRVVVDENAVNGKGKCLLMTERDYEVWAAATTTQEQAPPPNTTTTDCEKKKVEV